MKPFDVYQLFNIEPVKASGSRITDKNGREYLDLYGGHAVISVGHSHPAYTKALHDQIDRIGFYSNSIENPLQHILAEKLGNISNCKDYNLFLCNSGAEANENALKMASFVNGRKKIVAMGSSFHGRTSLALAATDNPKIRANINAYHEVSFIEMNSYDAALEAIDSDTCAVIIEGIQGVAGVKIPEIGFLNHLEQLCRKHGALLILDEVQSGYGRSGKFFAHQYAEIQPDIITVAKGMGNGFPVAGTLIHNSIEAVKEILGTTFGGNYLACAAANAVLDIIHEEKLMENACTQGDFILNELNGLPGINNIRGKGLMIGIELDVPASGIRNILLKDHGIFTGSSSDKNTLRILPALNLSREDACYFTETFKYVLQKEFA